ncbi:hypothetical protein R6Q57_018395 [Mikania cordata]
MNFGNQPAAEIAGGNGRPPGSFHLARQGSIYSLTFDELQNTMCSNGKDFGSMNMDELLKSIWNAEETQTAGNNTTTSIGGGGGGGGGGGVGGGSIHRQGSLTLPRTLSQKTVDEVWKDISKEFNSFSEPNLPQRQQTLGEMTLEEFLLKAGVVREEHRSVYNKPTDNGLFSDLTKSQNNPVFEFQHAASRTAAMTVNNTNQIEFQPSHLPLNVNGVRSTQGQPQSQQLFPMTMPSSKPLNGSVTRNGNMVVSNGMLHGLAVPGGVTMGSPMVSSDGMGKNNGDTSSVSPSPYQFSGIVRGRKGGAVEKVVERRQRRMIKNRESAARSRARKQAYTMELEAEVAKLKEQNQELKRKAEMMEIKQNQVYTIRI